jgi:hypothetical protein
MHGIEYVKFEIVIVVCVEGSRESELSITRGTSNDAVGVEVRLSVY